MKQNYFGMNQINIANLFLIISKYIKIFIFKIDTTKTFKHNFLPQGNDFKICLLRRNHSFIMIKIDKIWRMILYELSNLNNLFLILSVLHHF